MHRLVGFWSTNVDLIGPRICVFDTNHPDLFIIDEDFAKDHN